MPTTSIDAPPPLRQGMLVLMLGGVLPGVLSVPIAEPDGGPSIQAATSFPYYNELPLRPRNGGGTLAADAPPTYTTDNVLPSPEQWVISDGRVDLGRTSQLSKLTEACTWVQGPVDELFPKVTVCRPELRGSPEHPECDNDAYAIPLVDPDDGRNLTSALNDPTMNNSITSAQFRFSRAWVPVNPGYAMPEEVDLATTSTAVATSCRIENATHTILVKRFGPITFEVGSGAGVTFRQDVAHRPGMLTYLVGARAANLDVANNFAKVPFPAVHDHHSITFDAGNKVPAAWLESTEVSDAFTSGAPLTANHHPTTFPGVRARTLKPSGRPVHYLSIRRPTARRLSEAPLPDAPSA